MTELLDRVGPAPVLPLTGGALGVILVLTIVIVSTRAWRWFRLGVTLVHELGHALVGICCGRRFTGFVVRGDMSGHAVTSGPPTGFGRVATTWAGYPMPALFGALLIWAATRGWAAPVLTISLAVLVACLVQVRSFTTAVVMLLALAGVGALWWFRSDALQVHVLSAAGLVLIVGAWRHLLTVSRSGGRSDDPAVLARLTRVPRWLWLVSFAAACAVATWWAGRCIIGGL